MAESLGRRCVAEQSPRTTRKTSCRHEPRIRIPRLPETRKGLSLSPSNVGKATVLILNMYIHVVSGTLAHRYNACSCCDSCEKLGVPVSNLLESGAFIYSAQPHPTGYMQMTF